YEFLPRSTVQSQQAQYVPPEILFYLRILDLQPLFWHISYHEVMIPCPAARLPVRQVLQRRSLP
ncbi:MAG: hypothetical protein U9O95_00415, partial [Candidatus Marinimicrobia bacterium]|nr:hypothetical protein [Candidatus Neomarinimicrobiota bacterium]